MTDHVAKQILRDVYEMALLSHFLPIHAGASAAIDVRHFATSAVSPFLTYDLECYPRKYRRHDQLDYAGREQDKKECAAEDRKAGESESN